MKILVLSNCSLDENQGSGYVILNTSRCLTLLGHEVDLIPPSKFSFLPGLKHRANMYRTSFGMARWVYRQRRTIKNYDLLIFYGAESAIAIFLLKTVLGFDLLTILHSNGIELSAANNLEKFKECITDRQVKKWYHLNNSFLFKYSYKTVNAILTVSKYDAEFVKNNLNIQPNKVFFIEPCLPEIYFRNASYKVEKKKIITYCGRWTSIKGRASIEYAIPKILKKFPEFIVRLIGVGDDFRVSDFFQEEFRSRIEVYPYIKNKEDLIDLYRSTSIFLFPSLTEGFGLVVIEAMINGCAVICGPTGIGGDLKNFEEAIVLDIPGGREVHSAIEALILDDQLRLKLSVNGKKRVEDRQWTNFADELANVLHSIVESSNQKERA